jgi:hypothetical protein
MDATPVKLEQAADQPDQAATAPPAEEVRASLEAVRRGTVDHQWISTSFGHDVGDRYGDGRCSSLLCGQGVIAARASRRGFTTGFLRS